jgi:hypothetical protein
MVGGGVHVNHGGPRDGPAARVGGAPVAERWRSAGALRMLARMRTVPLRLFALAASAYAALTACLTHPRAYGTFPRVLGRYVRQDSRFPLEQAVRRMTGATAQRLGLRDRGLVREGLQADGFDRRPSPEAPAGAVRDVRQRGRGRRDGRASRSRLDRPWPRRGSRRRRGSAAALGKLAGQHVLRISIPDVLSAHDSSSGEQTRSWCDAGRSWGGRSSPTRANRTGSAALGAPCARSLSLFATGQRRRVGVVTLPLGARTDSAGRYAINNVAPGRYVVRAQLIGFGAREDTVHVAAGQTATVNFRLTR